MRPAGPEQAGRGDLSKADGSPNTETRKSSSVRADRPDLLGRLYQIAGLDVTSATARRGCDRALTQMVESQLQAPVIKELLAKAFAGECGPESAEKMPSRTPGRTPYGLFSKEQVGRIIASATGVQLAKAHLLIAIGSEFERRILQKLSPRDIRAIICKGLDIHEALRDVMPSRGKRPAPAADKSSSDEPKAVRPPPESSGPPV